MVMVPGAKLFEEVSVVESTVKTPEVGSAWSVFAAQ
jgi:hypothetical protein